MGWLEYFLLSYWGKRPIFRGEPLGFRFREPKLHNFTTCQCWTPPGILSHIVWGDMFRGWNKTHGNWSQIAMFFAWGFIQEDLDLIVLRKMPRVSIGRCMMPYANTCVCVCVWTFSIEVKLVRFLLQGGQGHYVKPGPTKPDIMVDATWDAELCTCNFMDMMKVMFKHWSWGLLLRFVFQAVASQSNYMEHSLSWTWHRTCYQSYPSVYPVVDVRQGATGPGLRPWATPAQGKAWLGETKCRIYIFQPSNSSKYSS